MAEIRSSVVFREPIRGTVFGADARLLWIELIKEPEYAFRHAFKVEVVEAVSVEMRDERAMLRQVDIEVFRELRFDASILQEAVPSPEHFLFLGTRHELLIGKHRPIRHGYLACVDGKTEDQPIQGYKETLVNNQPCSLGAVCFRRVRTDGCRKVGLFHISPSLRKLSRACCSPTP
jgi:hypothetical protein